MCLILPRLHVCARHTHAALPLFSACPCLVHEGLHGVCSRRLLAFAGTPPPGVNISWFKVLSLPVATSEPDRATGQALFDVDLDSGREAKLQLVVVFGDDLPSLRQKLAGLLNKEDFDAATNQSDRAFEQRWRDAFTPNNTHFSGHLPTLHTEDAQIARTYYVSALTLVGLERTGWQDVSPIQCARLYPIAYSGPAIGKGVVASPGARPWGGSAFWFWDFSFAAQSISLLDPDFLRAILDFTNVTSGRWTQYNSFEMIGGQPNLPSPDGTGGGGLYACECIRHSNACTSKPHLSAHNDAISLARFCRQCNFRVRIAYARAQAVR